MCPICASAGVLTIAGAVSAAGLTGILVGLRSGRGRGIPNVNREEMSP
jgi:hypothetical protein